MAAVTVEVREASFVAAAVAHGGLPPPAFAEIAFAGRSNVGKSSLINMLVQRRKLVRTSSTPGATRQLALFRATLDLAGVRATLDLVDLPGYGFAKRSKAERRSWGTMIERYLEERVGLRGVVLIVDPRRGLPDDDRELVTYLDHIGRPLVVAATKVDKLGRAERAPLLRALEQAAGRRVVATSAETGEGRDALWAELVRMAGLAPSAGLPPPGRSG